MEYQDSFYQSNPAENGRIILIFHHPNAQKQFSENDQKGY